MNWTVVSRLTREDTHHYTVDEETDIVSEPVFHICVLTLNEVQDRKSRLFSVSPILGIEPVAARWKSAILATRPYGNTHHHHLQTNKTDIEGIPFPDEPYSNHRFVIFWEETTAEDSSNHCRTWRKLSFLVKKKQNKKHFDRPTRNVISYRFAL